jgi:hypothetical protein
MLKSAHCACCNMTHNPRGFSRQLFFAIVFFFQKEE